MWTHHQNLFPREKQAYLKNDICSYLNSAYSGFIPCYFLKLDAVLHLM